MSRLENLKNKIIYRQDISMSDIPFTSNEEVTTPVTDSPGFGFRESVYGRRNLDFVENPNRLILLAVLTGRLELLQELLDKFTMFDASKKVFHVGPVGQYAVHRSDRYDYMDFVNNTRGLRLLADYVTFNSGFNPYGLNAQVAAEHDPERYYSLLDVNHWMYENVNNILMLGPSPLQRVGAQGSYSPLTGTYTEDPYSPLMFPFDEDVAPLDGAKKRRTRKSSNTRRRSNKKRSKSRKRSNKKRSNRKRSKSRK